MQSSFYSPEELISLGFRSIGHNVLISRFARFYGIEAIEIGNNVRIDDFCILSGNIKLGSYIHVSAYSAIYGKFGVIMDDYSGLSPRCSIFSQTDDFSGDHLIGPMVDEAFTYVTGGVVRIGRYVQLGSGCTVMPGVNIGDGAAVGAMSLILHDLDPWKIYKGIPANYHKDRRKKILDLLR